MMTSGAKRALAKTIRELREKTILLDLREATERAYQDGVRRRGALGADGRKGNGGCLPGR